MSGEFHLRVALQEPCDPASDSPSMKVLLARLARQQDELRALSQHCAVMTMREKALLEHLAKIESYRPPPIFIYKEKD